MIQNELQKTQAKEVYESRQLDILKDKALTKLRLHRKVKTMN